MSKIKKKTFSQWGVLAVGIILGVIGWVSTTATMYATDQAAFCSRCHIMHEAAYTHQNSIHAKQACNECHLPAGEMARLPMKAQVGLHDIYMNNFGTMPDVIHATENMKDVIQANCRRCHEATTMTVDMTVKEYCTDCHRAVPHMNKAPIDQRKAADV